MAKAVQVRFFGNQTGEKAELIARGIFSVLVACQIALFFLTCWEMKLQQLEIEMGNRARIGEWLHDHGRPGESVYLEPLGYIGYFSKMRMIDWPGLVAPEVVRLRAEKKTTRVESLILDLQPDWVILRSWDFSRLKNSPDALRFQNEYQLVQVFDVNENLNKYDFVPGKLLLHIDASFGLFKKSAQ